MLLPRASLLCVLPLFGCAFLQTRPAPPPAVVAVPVQVAPVRAALTPAPAPPRASADGPLRFTVSVVSESPVAAAEDAAGNATLVFSLLGHLYRVDAVGGTAEPLTSGPAYDSEPTFSPDLRTLAFRSDRDGLPGIYLLVMSSASPGLPGSRDGGPAAVRPLAIDEGQVHSLPIFSADGKDVVYARHRRLPVIPEAWELVRKPIAGGAAQVLAHLAGAGEITGLTYSGAGRLWYSVAQRGPGGETRTQIFQLPERTPRLSLAGLVGALRPHPGGGLVARMAQRAGERQTLVLLGPHGEPPQVLRELAATFSLPGIGWLSRRGHYVVSDDGGLRILRPDGSLAGETGFHAEVELQTTPRAAVPLVLGGSPGQPIYRFGQVGQVVPGGGGAVRQAGEAAFDLHDRPHDKLLIGQDGAQIAAAAGRLWRKEAGGAWTALTAPGEMAYDPALSADGKTLVYCRAARSGAELVRTDPLPGADKAVLLAAGFVASPAIGDNGKSVLVTVTEGSGGTQLFRVPLGGGPAVSLAVRGGRDLHASPVGDGLCYSGASPRPGVLYRQAEGGAPRALTSLSSPLRFGTCAPDGSAIAYVRDGMVWLAPLRSDWPSGDGDGKPLAVVSAAGGEALAFTGDGKLTVPVLSGTLVVAVADALSHGAAHGAAQMVGMVGMASRPPFASGTPTGMPDAQPSAAPHAAAHAAPIDGAAGSPTESATLRPQDYDVLRPDPPAQVGRSGPVVIRHVTLLDPGSQRSLPDTTVLLADGRVTWVGPSAQAPAAPADATVVDGRRRFALPGLIEMHGRLAPFDPRAYLAYGVTTIRDVRAGHQALDYQAAGETGQFPVPRIIPAAEVPVLKTEAEVDAWVRALAAAGYRLARLDPALPRHLRRAAGAAAARYGLRLSAPARTVEDFTTAALDGVSLIETQLASRAGPAADVLGLLGRGGVAVTTMLHPLGLAAHQLRRQYPSHNPVLLELAVSPEALAAHRAALEGSQPEIVALNPEADREVDRAMSQVRRMLAAGVQVVAGTDAGAPGSFAGVALPWELYALSRGGLSPWQVLRMATVDAAAALPSAEIGQIVAGARADLILLSGSPLSDLRNLERVVLTVRGGQVYRPEALLLGRDRPANQ